MKYTSNFLVVNVVKNAAFFKSIFSDFECQIFSVDFWTPVYPWHHRLKLRHYSCLLLSSSFSSFFFHFSFLFFLIKMEINQPLLAWVSRLRASRLFTLNLHKDGRLANTFNTAEAMFSVLSYYLAKGAVHTKMNLL